MPKRHTATWARGRDGDWELLVAFATPRAVRRGRGINKRFTVDMLIKDDQKPRRVKVRLTSRAFLGDDGTLRAFARIET